MHKQVRHAGFGGCFQPDLTVQPAVGEVVDDKSERRQSRVLARIQPHGEQIFCIAAHKIGNLQRKRRVAAQMLAHELAVYIDGSLVGCAVKPQKQPRRVGHGQGTAVAADHLVVGRVGVVERQFPAGVGQPHRLAGHRCAGAERVAPVFGKFPIVTKAVFHCTVIPSHKIEIISSSAWV